MDELLKIINNILESNGEEKVKEIEKKDSLRDDLGLNSFDLAELTVRIEDIYDIDVFEDGIVETIGEIMDKLKL
mgnify:CR=1 FL=1|tara:strand:+ start:1333 stop:1554 length:222 start_codon:yes stop_codon:yes gene_type:complete